MKALEYLKDDLENIDPRRTHTIQYLEECIAELEALDNRSCDNCKTKNCSVKIILVEKDEISTDYFNCNDWESK